jgi:hypothetical protein
MLITLELSQIITLGLALAGGIAGFGKLLLSQFEKRLRERFAEQDKARAAGQSALREIFEQHMIEERKNSDALQSLERDFLRFQAELPLHYVRREDYVRGQTVIEAKLDALYNKLEIVQLKGAAHG